MVGLPVPEEELTEFTPAQRESLKEYARLVAELKKGRCPSGSAVASVCSGGCWAGVWHWA